MVGIVFLRIIFTANNFWIIYSRKRIGQNSFPNFIYIFPQSFMIFCQELLDPKRKPDLNLGSQGCHHEKLLNFTPLDLNSGPLHQYQVLCHWTTTARYLSFQQINISSLQNYQRLSFLPVTFTGLAALFPQLGSWHDNDKILISVAGVLGLNPECSLIFFHADILVGLGSNLVFKVPFGITFLQRPRSVELHMWNSELRYG